jgi:hypothetical protein
MRRRKRVPRSRHRPRRPRPVRLPEDAEDRGEIVQMLREMLSHAETSPLLSGGDLDADWLRAHLSGDEAVGGSVATPDQDVVDEIGRALGVEQASDAEVRTSEEILRERDRFRWHLERKAADREEEEEAD